jgi:hypothetical protein
LVADQANFMREGFGCGRLGEEGSAARADTFSGERQTGSSIPWLTRFLDRFVFDTHAN